MKFRLLSFIIVSVLLISLSACGRNSNNSEASLNTNNESNTVSVTFPEGYTVRQIAEKLEINGVCSADDFLAQVNNSEYIDEFDLQINNSKDHFYLLEGYIFPDTYEFYKNEKASSVIKRFLRNFNAKFTDEMKQKAVSLGFNTDEILTLASIIQVESGGSDEAARVSSVLHNRLNSNSFKNLQCDACSIYLKTYIKPYCDSSVYDEYCNKYNTYMCENLPAGPICNPGIKSIKAALSPADTDYYFFVTDSENIYHYANTFSEHESNCRVAGIG